MKNQSTRTADNIYVSKLSISLKWDSWETYHLWNCFSNQGEEKIISKLGWAEKYFKIQGGWVNVPRQKGHIRTCLVLFDMLDTNRVLFDMRDTNSVERVGLTHYDCWILTPALLFLKKLLPVSKPVRMHIHPTCKHQLVRLVQWLERENGYNNIDWNSHMQLSIHSQHDHKIIDINLHQKHTCYYMCVRAY